MKNTIKLLTIALAITIATQSHGMWSRFTTGFNAMRASFARSAMASRIAPTRAFAFNPGMLRMSSKFGQFSHPLATAVVRPTYSRLAAYRAAAGFGTAAALAFYSKPARAEGAETSEK